MNEQQKKVRYLLVGLILFVVLCPLFVIVSLSLGNFFERQMNAPWWFATGVAPVLFLLPMPFVIVLITRKLAKTFSFLPKGWVAEKYHTKNTNSQC